MNETIAAFSMTLTGTAQAPRRGVMFRPGDYGPKGFYTEADLERMAGVVPVRMGHGKTLLEGRLGTVRAFVGFDAGGKKVLMGEWSEPAALSELLGDTPRKVSVEIGLADKRLVAVALEAQPHITDAALFSAVSGDANGINWAQVEAARRAMNGEAPVADDPRAGAIGWHAVDAAREAAGLPRRIVSLDEKTAQVNYSPGMKAQLEARQPASESRRREAEIAAAQRIIDARDGRRF